MSVLELVAGNRYLLRNGAKITLTGPFVLQYKNGTAKQMNIGTWSGWRGQDDNGQKCSWELDGCYSPMGHKHQLDIIAPVRE